MKIYNSRSLVDCATKLASLVKIAEENYEKG